MNLGALRRLLAFEQRKVDAAARALAEIEARLAANRESARALREAGAEERRLAEALPDGLRLRAAYSTGEKARLARLDQERASLEEASDEARRTVFEAHLERRRIEIALEAGDREAARLAARKETEALEERLSSARPAGSGDGGRG